MKLRLNTMRMILWQFTHMSRWQQLSLNESSVSAYPLDGLWQQRWTLMNCGRPISPQIGRYMLAQPRTPKWASIPIAGRLAFIVLYNGLQIDIIVDMIENLWLDIPPRWVLRMISIIYIDFYVRSSIWGHECIQDIGMRGTHFKYRPSSWGH